MEWPYFLNPFINFWLGKSWKALNIQIVLLDRLKCLYFLFHHKIKTIYFNTVPISWKYYYYKRIGKKVFGYNLSDLTTHCCDRYGFFGNLYCFRFGKSLLVFLHPRKEQTFPEPLVVIIEIQLTQKSSLVYIKTYNNLIRNLKNKK